MLLYQKLLLEQMSPYLPQMVWGQLQSMHLAAAEEQDHPCMIQKLPPHLKNQAIFPASHWDILLQVHFRESMRLLLEQMQVRNLKRQHQLQLEQVPHYLHRIKNQLRLVV